MTQEQIEIKATVGAYMRDEKYRADVVQAIKDPEMHRALVGSVLVYSVHDMSSVWARVGDAEICVKFYPEDVQVAAAIKALNAQLAKARAEFMQVQAGILERISKLQALEYVEAA